MSGEGLGLGVAEGVVFDPIEVDVDDGEGLSGGEGEIGAEGDAVTAKLDALREVELFGARRR